MEGRNETAWSWAQHFSGNCTSNKAFTDINKRDQRGRGEGNPNLSSAMSSFNSNTDVRDGREGAEEEGKKIHRKECERPARETNGNKQVTVCSLLWEIL